MLGDYKFNAWYHYRVPCDGWLFSTSKLENGGVSRLHDQDYIHNSSYLINILDCPTPILQLGGDMCACVHIGLVIGSCPQWIRHSSVRNREGSALRVIILMFSKQNWWFLDLVVYTIYGVSLVGKPMHVF